MYLINYIIPSKIWFAFEPEDVKEEQNIIKQTLLFGAENIKFLNILILMNLEKLKQGFNNSEDNIFEILNLIIILLKVKPIKKYYFWINLKTFIIFILNNF